MERSPPLDVAVGQLRRPPADWCGGCRLTAPLSGCVGADLALIVNNALLAFLRPALRSFSALPGPPASAGSDGEGEPRAGRAGAAPAGSRSRSSGWAFRARESGPETASPALALAHALKSAAAQVGTSIFYYCESKIFLLYVHDMHIFANGDLIPRSSPSGLAPVAEEKRWNPRKCVPCGPPPLGPYPSPCPTPRLILHKNKIAK